MISLPKREKQQPMAPLAAAVTRPLRILMVTPTSFFADYGGHIRILGDEVAKLLQVCYQIIK